jgi:hypothetical protein
MPVAEIPRERLDAFITDFTGTALFQMNSVIKSDMMNPTVDSIISILKEKFSNYPLHLIAATFDQGSLGQLGGTSSFTVRNVYIWLASMKETADRLAFEAWSRKEDKKKKEELNSWNGIQKGACLFGTAMYLKAKWVSDGVIARDNWDNYSLDKIVNLLKAGERENNITPQMARL